MLMNLPCSSRYFKNSNQSHNVATQKRYRGRKNDIDCLILWGKSFPMNYYPLEKFVAVVVIKKMQR